MRRKSWRKWWSVLRLAVCRACSICSRRLRRFIVCRIRGSKKVSVGSSETETTEHLVLEGGYVLPSICRPRAVDSIEVGKNATVRVKHG